MLRLSVIFSFLFFSFSLSGQENPLDQVISLDVKDIELEQVLFDLIDGFDVKLVFNNSIIPKKKVTVHVDQQPLSFVFSQLLRNTNLVCNTAGQLIIIKENPVTPDKQFYTISGFVKDESNGEPLVGASVFCQLLGMGTITNNYGFFSLKLPEGDWRIDLSYLGFSPLEERVSLSSNKKIDWALKGSARLLEIIVHAQDSTSYPIHEISTHQIPLEELDFTPTLVGEKDVLRNIQLLPGVQTGADGVGGLSVRGGNSSQNLVIIDGVPVYSTAHAGGMLSIFNSEVIRSAKIIKGGFPARYGGRLSSVIELRTKEGNLEKWSGWVNASLATINVGIEGPIVKKKSSIIVTGRTSFVNAYLRPESIRLKKENDDFGYSEYVFSDWNAKINYFFSNKDKVYLNFYLGNDDFQDQSIVMEEFKGIIDRDTFDLIDNRALGRGLVWENRIGGFRWNHLYSDQLFGNTSISYSELSAGLNVNYTDSIFLIEDNSLQYNELFTGQFSSGITELSFKQDFDFVPRANQYIRFGIEWKNRTFFSRLLGYDEKDLELMQGLDVEEDEIKANSLSVYWEKEMQGKRWMVNFGLRGVYHTVSGVKYYSAEPRLSASYSLGGVVLFRTAYSKMTQFLHLLSPTNIGLATDLWVPSTDEYQPQVADQFIVGFDADLGNGVSVSVEGYFKKMKNLLNFSEGSVLFNDWKKNVTTGIGSAKGIDFLLQRTGRQFDFKLSYSYSKTDRQFGNINLGRTFPFKYDRRHDLKISVFYKLKKHWNFSAVWVYGTGAAATLPRARYQVKLLDYLPVKEVDVLFYGTKNSFRLPAYHRLDIGVNYSFQTGNVKHKLGVGVYNTYNNINPLYYEVRSRFVTEEEELIQQFYFVQVNLASILPSFNYSIKF